MAFVALIAALLVAAAFNLAGSRYWREYYPLYGAPIAEETAKTVSAVMIGAPLVTVHILFGIAEVFWDLGAGGGVISSLSSMLLHLILGFVTFWSWYYSGHWWAGLVVGMLVHLGWNALVHRLRP